MSGTASAATATYTGAKTTTAARTGYAWDITSRDTSSDNQFVSAPWATTNGISGSIVNKNGAYTSVTETMIGDAGARLAKVKACRSNTALPMSCSAWVATGY